MQPVWEQSISFKHALALAAVQKRRFDEEINQYKTKTAALEQEIAQLKLNLAKYEAAARPERLLSYCFNPSSSSPSSAENESSAAINFSLQLETLAISATLWNRAGEILSPNIHGFLCQVFNYSARRRGGRGTAVADNNENSPNAAGATPSSSFSTSSFLLAAGNPTPMQALIQLTSDIITAPSSSSSFPKASLDEILVKAASCLGELCKHPLDFLTLQDFSLLREFISQLLNTACCSRGKNISEKSPENEEKNRSSASQHQQPLLLPTAPAATKNAFCLLEAFQSSCGTGCLVLGCAAHCYQSFIRRLRGLVTGELEILEPHQQQLEQPSQLPPPLPPAASPPTEGTTVEVGDYDEESLVSACGKIAQILQTCLRELPSWSLEMPFQDEYLREIAAAVWDVSAASKVIAPAHPEVAKQGQRCAALLVSALQHMSSSADDCHTTMNDLE